MALEKYNGCEERDGDALEAPRGSPLLAYVRIRFVLLVPHFATSSSSYAAQTADFINPKNGCNNYMSCLELSDLFHYFLTSLSAVPRSALQFVAVFPSTKALIY